MKLFGRKPLTTITCAAAMAVQAIAFASCDSLVFDDLDPCDEGLRLRFVYDWNMEFANAFPSQVDCLTLLVYDADGRYVTTRTVTDRTLLSDENWRMDLDLDPGHYRLLAYGGMSCPEASFVFEPLPGPSVPMDGVDVRLRPDCITSPVGTELHDLFYGSLDIDIPAQANRYTEATLPMLKDTNNLRVILQNVDGSPLSDSDFDYTLTADNTLMNSLNEVVPTAVTTYMPWARGEVAAGVNPADESDVIGAFAEFSTARFTVADPVRLTVTRASDHSTVLSIPLINYLILSKSVKYDSMDAQEFLDRESRWDLVLLLQNGSWVNTRIIVNGWVVRLNNSEL